MVKPCTIYRTPPDATLESELDVLANALRFILFESNASTKAAGTSGGEDARKEEPSASGKTIIPKRG